MAKPLKDAGMIQLLLTRLTEERLPEALSLKKKVDSGECLSEYEISTLLAMMEDGYAASQLATKYPEYKELFGRVAELYTEIANKATENEQRASGITP